MVGRLRKALVGIPIVVLVVALLFAATPFMATCGGHDEEVTAVLLRCPRAVELIGDDAHPAKLGLACGSTKTSGDSGTAGWDLPYTGSKGRGTVSFRAWKDRGEWEIGTAVLEAGGETIDLLLCGGPGPVRNAGGGGGGGTGGGGGQLAQTNADAATATFDGKVIRSNHPTILTGSTCQGTMKRERGATTAAVSVTCKAGVGESGGAQTPPADVALYDGEPRFSMNVGDPSRREDDQMEMEDAKTSEQDKSPGCRLSGAGGSGTLTLWDTTPAAYEIVVAL